MGKIGKYYAIYKCPLCNKIFRISETAAEIDEDEIPDLLTKVILNQQFFGNPHLYQAPLYLPHLCGNGDGGLAQLAGFKKKDEIKIFRRSYDKK